MNKIFEVLVYTHAEDKDDAYGEADIEKGFDTLQEAEKYYFNIRYYFGKQLMKYESLEPDADGHVIHEDHKKDMIQEKSFDVSKIDVLAVCQVNFDESDLVEFNGLTEEEETERIKDAAINSDVWRVIE